MRVLGALLAGGEAKRFGSDKALAQLAGRNLIDHCIALLETQCSDIIICGRQYREYDHITDRPLGQGPLGAINAALLYALDHSYDAVISFPCDTICDIINDTAISDASIDADSIKAAWFDDCINAQYIIDQPVIGYWPVAMSPVLDGWIADQKRRAMMAWIEHCGAIGIVSRNPLTNINRPDDLRRIKNLG